jgi:hypothetical protein
MPQSAQDWNGSNDSGDQKAAAVEENCDPSL